MDLERHAADKVKRALDDVYQLTDDPNEMIRIALLASSVCIGGCAGFIAGLADVNGTPISEQDAKLQVIELLRRIMTDGAEAVHAALTSAV